MNKVSVGLVVVTILGGLLLRGEWSTGESWNFSEDKIFAGIELERRDFVMSIIMLEDGIIFELANEEENDWQSSSQYVILNTISIKEAEKIYKANGERELDFSHMKILFVDTDLTEKYLNKDTNKGQIYNNVNQYKYNIEYMYTEEKFGENILVCELSGDLKKMTANAIKDEKALAVKVENILTTSGKDKGRELYKVRNENN